MGKLDTASVRTASRQHIKTRVPNRMSWRGLLLGGETERKLGDRYPLLDMVVVVARVRVACRTAFFYITF